MDKRELDNKQKAFLEWFVNHVENDYIIVTSDEVPYELVDVFAHPMMNNLGETRHKVYAKKYCEFVLIHNSYRTEMKGTLNRLVKRFKCSFLNKS